MKPDNNMINYYTMAAWVRGYASSMDPSNEVNRAVLARLGLIEKLLRDVWDQYAKENGL